MLIDNPTSCGLGHGEKCCAFLVAGQNGFECGREIKSVAHGIRLRLSAGTINAKYDPGNKPYPECQQFGLTLSFLE